MKIEKHYIFLFVLILIFLVPYILGYSTLDNYNPCNIVCYHDCTGQNAGPREVYDGNFLVEDPFVYENDDVNIGTISMKCNIVTMHSMPSTTNYLTYITHGFL